MKNTLAATRPGTGRRGWALAGACLGLVLLVTLGASLLGLRTFSAVDILSMKAPWRADTPTIGQAQVPYAGDTADTYLPKAQYVHDEVREGRFPWWTNTAVGGEPLLAVPDAGLMTPVAAPFWILPTWWAPAWVKLFEVVAACAGMILLFRRLELLAWCGLVAGTAFVLSGFMVAWTGWPQTRTAALIPLLFYAVERLCQDRDTRSTALLAGVVAGMVLGGFPSVTGFSLAAAGVHLVVRGALPWAGARLLPGLGLRALAGLALGIGLAAFQLLPFLARWSSIDFSYRETTPGTHPPLAAAATLLGGDVFGLGTPGQPFRGPINPVEIQAYAGAAVLILALVAVTMIRLTPVARVTSFSYAVLAAVIASITWSGGPLLTFLQAHVPVFDTNPIGRIVAVLGFLLAALAGAGLHGLATRSWQVRGIPLFLLGGLVSAGLAMFVMRAARQDFLTPAMGQRLRVLVLFFALAVLLVGVARVARGRAATAAIALLPVLLISQALPWVHRWWPQNDPDLFFPRTAVHDRLERVIGHERMASQGNVPLTGTSRAYGLRTMDGRAFVPDRWRDLMTAISPAVFKTRTYSTLPAGREVLDSPILDRLAVRYVVTSPDNPPYGELSEPSGLGASSITLTSSPDTSPLDPMRVRGIGVRVLASEAVTRLPVLVHAEVVSPTGTRLARGLVEARALGSTRWIPFPDTVVPQGARVRLWATRGTATLAADASGRPSLGLARVPAGDALRVLVGAGATVWERTGALPRFRLADHAQVIADPAARVASLASSTLPSNTVVLERGVPLRGDPSLPSRQLTVEADTDGRIVLRVTAGREPYLVVADGAIGNWRASVNGRRTPLVEADHALAALVLPKGAAAVVLEAEVDGLRRGAAVSTGAALLLAGMLTAPVYLRGRAASRPSRG